MSDPITFPIRQSDNSRALLFIHGFSGESHQTFGLLPAFIAGDGRLTSWDIHCIGYPTGLCPDITGIWAADPSLTTLAGYLTTELELGRFKRYSQLALVAHSMGGLIVQRAVLNANLGDRVAHVMLFGTPSNGLKRAKRAGWLKRQVADMAAGGAFVTSLRTDWNARYPADPPFSFYAVAGVRDEFVPTESSVDPFPARFRGYVSGNHLEMVKPRRLDDDTTVLLGNLLAPSVVKAAGAPTNLDVGALLPSAARFAASVDALQPRESDLPREKLVELVLALEMTGRQDEAIAMLERHHEGDTELSGVLGGRLKRRWLADPDARAAEGERAYELYGDAFEQAERAGDHPQAYYNGINCAFLELALHTNPSAAREVALRALEHCRKSPRDKWRLATEGEASLYLHAVETALESYSEARKLGPTPRELSSMLQQALWVSRLLGLPDAEDRLRALFAVGAPA